MRAPVEARGAVRWRLPAASVLWRGALCTMLLWCVLRTASAQLLYDTARRPPGIAYHVLKSDHFDIIFQAGSEAEAREAAAILEAELPRAQTLFAHRRPLRMPVVLNAYNDRSNGFVSPLPFRQEIHLASIRGNQLSPRFSSWMWTVAPHELAHAAQAQSGRGWGVGAIVRQLAPDVARAINLGLPPGITEGAAVFYESRLQTGAGRLQHSLFQMRFRAAAASSRPWTLAQMLETPAYTRPRGRHYIGGANFYAHFAANDSGRVFQRASAFHYRFPFLGYGVELWYGARASPARLGRRFRQDMLEKEEARLAALGCETEARVLAQGPGRSHRRPQWLSDLALVVYMTGYDARPGFYRIDVQSGAASLVSHQLLPEDNFFHLAAGSLLFARYERDRFVPTQWVADAFRLHVSTGEVARLTHGGGVHAPVEGSRGLWALQNDGQFNAWVRLAPSGEAARLSAPSRALFIQLAPSPNADTVAVIARAEGRQGLYRATWDADGRPRFAPWIFFREGSIYDASWSADGRYLLFAADPGGVANIYAADLRLGRIMQLTNVPYGALEASLSPDGRTLVFVEYQHERFDLMHMPFDPGQASEAPDSVLLPLAPNLMILREEPAFRGGEVLPYRARDYLRPRLILPSARYERVRAGPLDKDLGVGAGLRAQSGDPLQKWAYGLEGLYQDRRLWGSLTIGATLLRGRASLQAYSDPSTVLASVGEASRRLGRQQRGIRLGYSLPMVLASNVKTTTARLSLDLALEQERFFGEDAFQRRASLSPGAILASRLQKNVRDMLPNTGTVVAMSSALDLFADGGGRRRAMMVSLSRYASLSLRRHSAVRLQAELLAQSRGSVIDLDRYLPRGYEETYLGQGAFLRWDLELLQPLWFIDNGFALAPLYFKALYAYGFAQTLHPVGARHPWERLSSTGAGIGLQLRVFYYLDFDVRLGASYLIEERRLAWTLR